MVFYQLPTIKMSSKDRNCRKASWTDRKDLQLKDDGQNETIVVYFIVSRGVFDFDCGWPY